MKYIEKEKAKEDKKKMKKAKKNNKDDSFALTPEALALSSEFANNKGKLPWPLEKGVVIQGFGRQPHPVVKTTTIQSNGVVLATEPSAQVRAVFEGEVMSVIVIKGSNPSVLIRHGNFITLYTNLAKLYVKKGEKVKAKQTIGEVFTNNDGAGMKLRNKNRCNEVFWRHSCELFIKFEDCNLVSVMNLEQLNAICQRSQRRRHLTWRKDCCWMWIKGQSDNRASCCDLFGAVE